MFDIDVVIPMVFPADKEWLKEYDEAAKREHQPWSETRYRSMGLESLQVDLIKTHMPWVRKIWIILAMPSQYQDWMRQENVEVVYHHHFIPREYCPAFSAYTIEMFMHQIKGLAEHFIYFNDDMFPVCHVDERDFFIGHTASCTQHVFYPRIIEFNGNSKNSFWQVCYHSWLMADRHFHLNSTRAMLGYGHGPNPMSKSVIKQAFKENEKEILDSITTFRSSGNLLQYLWCHYCFLGEYENGMPMGAAADDDKTMYLSTALSDELLSKMLAYATDNPYILFLCYNDTDFGLHTEAKRKILTDYLMKTMDY